ncbi:tetratricopeptide repeat protein [Chitinophaga agrisoli]|uniref:tetratricopeptide repeat protein n=1 Tax=Chitinophaga agrisoli TaxID=2607653 RepID=UPI001661C0D5|nr:tetratricopeptide repeat protein [Chitinophaga agrisoli]
MSVTLSASLYGQEQKSVLKTAEEAYARKEYAVAGALYSRIAHSKGDKMPIGRWIKMALSYQQIGDFEKASEIYQHIVTRPDRPAGAFFNYGEVLRQLEQYTAAREQYNQFSTANADSLQLKNMALQSCDSAAVWAQQPSAVQLKPVKELNTPGSDMVSGVVKNGLVIMSNGYRSLAMKGNPESHPATDKRTEQPYYKAYLYRQFTADNSNRFLEELSPALFEKYDYHIGPVCLNRTEDTLYATISIQGGAVSGVRLLQLYQSVKQNGQWSSLVLMPGINISGYSSSQAVLSTDGNTLYLVSDRPGGYGQTDLWYAEKQADGSWGQPVNCGNKINTIAAEIFPTINEEGALYFSSKGHPGMGGFDIFRAKGAKASWNTPENMKAPFNSGADDIGLILQDGRGYLSSNKQNGPGKDDIYSF